MAAYSNAINLTWTDGSNDEPGLQVERSPDGLNNWVVIADLGAGMDAHGDAGLDAATQYFLQGQCLQQHLPMVVPVDVYRDGVKVGTAVTGGSFDDFTDQKGGATYEHQVCESGGDTNCSSVITTTF